MKKRLWKKKGMVGPGTLAELLQGVRAGSPQTFGKLSLIPLLAVDRELENTEMANLSQLEWESAPQLSLRNSTSLPMIVPMQLAYLEYGLPSQAICELQLLGPHSEQQITDAASLTPPDAFWNLQLPDQFIAMPHMLRKSLFFSAGERSMQKLWPAILQLQKQLGWEQGYVTPRQKRQCAERLIGLRKEFVLLPAQTGYVLLWEGQPIGIEIGPNSAWWADWYPRLRDYSVAPLCFLPEFEVPQIPDPQREIQSRQRQEAESAARKLLAVQKAQHRLVHLGVGAIDFVRRPQKGGNHILDIHTKRFAGQSLMAEQKVRYLSLFDREKLQL